MRPAALRDAERLSSLRGSHRLRAGRRGLSFKRAVDELSTRGDRPIVAEILAFLGSSERGIVPGKGDPRRGTLDPRP